MFVGKFPDVFGKERDLVVREGQVKCWRDDAVTVPEDGGVFYEVLPNSKLASQVLDLSRKQAQK